MATVDWSAFFLGNAADMDTDEGTMAGEGAASLIGTYGSPAAPISDNVITLTTDSGTNGTMERDNVGTTDDLTYETSPGGPTATTTIDSIYAVNVVLTHDDGNTSTLNGIAFVIQDDDGNQFLVIRDFVHAFLPDVFDKAVDQIEIQTVTQDDVSSLNQSDFGTHEFTSTSGGPTICFLAGTLIQTPGGDIAVEDLKPGDLVSTLDHGDQPVVWIGQRKMNFSGADLAYKPYRIKPGSLGPGRPKRDLKVSRQHRLLIETPEGQVLAPVCGLEKLRGVSAMARCKSAHFYTILLPCHAILFAEGALAESFYPGPIGLHLLPRQSRQHLLDEFPGLMNDPETAYGPHARPVISRGEAVRLLQTGPRKRRVPPQMAAPAMGHIPPTSQTANAYHQSTS